MTHRETSLRVEVNQRADAAVIRLTGEVDIATAPRLTDAIEGLKAPGPVVVDLSGVTFMDSTGMRALVDAEQLALAGKRRFAIANPSRSVIRLLELVELRERFPELPSVDEASVAQLASEPSS